MNMNTNYILNNPDEILNMVQEETKPLVNPFAGPSGKFPLTAQIAVTLFKGTGYSRYVGHTLTDWQESEGWSDNQLWMAATILRRLHDMNVGADRVGMSNNPTTLVRGLMKQPKEVRNYLTHNSEELKTLLGGMRFHWSRFPRIKSVRKLKLALKGCHALQKSQIQLGIEALIRVGGLQPSLRGVFVSAFKEDFKTSYDYKAAEQTAWQAVHRHQGSSAPWADYQAWKQEQIRRQEWTDGTDLLIESSAQGMKYEEVFHLLYKTEDIQFWGLEHLRNASQWFRREAGRFAPEQLSELIWAGLCPTGFELPDLTIRKERADQDRTETRYWAEYRIRKSIRKMESFLDSMERVDQAVKQFESARIEAEYPINVYGGRGTGLTRYFDDALKQFSVSQSDLGTFSDRVETFRYLIEGLKHQLEGFLFYAKEGEYSPLWSSYTGIEDGVFQEPALLRVNRIYRDLGWSLGCDGDWDWAELASPPAVRIGLITESQAGIRDWWYNNTWQRLFGDSAKAECVAPC